ncbi:glycerate kinase [Thorsellia anophelis]|uniref:Glycerate kinase n=1 Tax=Thorsellia anophelis DSM 18579 TaxID=1123402 RepID=A0A1H9YF11_9GAMM|nr:glycerate kinase [Thorsellia anophelis]SES67551.1 glycerate kinase [Thorsellia anophelis DSM 18579]
MHIVIAPDSYKESLSATRVAEIIKMAFVNHFPEAKYSLLPLADGGEGTVEAILYAKTGNPYQTKVLDPLLREVDANWGIIDDGKTAVIEMAAASGLPLLSESQRDPCITSTYGTGQLILAALDKGVNKIIIGLGGSATNDAGAGIIQALGGKLTNIEGQNLPPGGLALTEFDRLDLSEIDPRLSKVELIVACDVNNPLCGLNGASHIFGGQKGADESTRYALDSALMHFASKIETEFETVCSSKQSMGAAGGAPYGLSIIHPKLKIVSGIEFILNELKYDVIIQQADLVITGEGKMDNQTLEGKTPLGVAKIAKQANIPVIGLCGVVGDESDQLRDYFDAVFPSIQSLKSLEATLQAASNSLYHTAVSVAAVTKMQFK